MSEELFAKILDNTHDADGVLKSVRPLIPRMAPGHDTTLIESVFAFVMKLFAGRIEGFQPLRTPYHNRTHTLEVFLCAAHLLHGRFLSGERVTSPLIDSVLVGALFHDTGYVLTSHEGNGSGAEHTNDHVRRGIALATSYLASAPASLRSMIEVSILATDHRLDPNGIDYPSPEHRTSAFLLATADMVGQMASREYLERLLFLYYEFKEAGIGNFADSNDLLEKTLDFYTASQKRLFLQLEGVVANLSFHFRDTLGDERNIYLAAVDQNIAYLQQVLSHDRDERLNYLKRGGIVEKAMSLLH